MATVRAGFAATLGVLAGGAALVAAVLVLCRPDALGGAPGVPARHPAAVVLLSGPDRLVTADLETRRVAGDVALRSLALDVAVDARSGLAVTAQCGGVGDAADDAIGLFDVRVGGRPSYVELPRANPGVVACSGGRAFVEHGVFEDGGLFVSIVDLAGRSVVATASAPDGPGVRMVCGPRGLSVLAAAGDETDGLRLTTFDTTGRVRGEPLRVPAGTRLLAADAEGRLGLFGGGTGVRSGSSPWFADIESGVSSPPVALSGLSSVSLGCLTTGHAVAAAGEEGVGACAGTLLVIDRRSRRVSGAVTLDGVVMALCPWGETVLAVTRDPCRLVAVDPAARRVVFGVDLPPDRIIGADVEILAADDP